MQLQFTWVLLCMAWTTTEHSGAYVSSTKLLAYTKLNVPGTAISQPRHKKSSVLRRLRAASRRSSDAGEFVVSIDFGIGEKPTNRQCE